METTEVKNVEIPEIEELEDSELMGVVGGVGIDVEVAPNGETVSVNTTGNPFPIKEYRQFQPIQGVIKFDKLEPLRFNQ